MKLLEDIDDGEAAAASKAPSLVLTLGLAEDGGVVIDELEPQLDILCL